MFKKRQTNKQKTNSNPSPKQLFLLIILCIKEWCVISSYIMVFPKKHDPLENWAHAFG